MGDQERFWSEGIKIDGKRKLKGGKGGSGESHRKGEGDIAVQVTRSLLRKKMILVCEEKKKTWWKDGENTYSRFKRGPA